MRRWSKLLATFVAGQTLVQGLNALTGLLLVRWMSEEAYAQYSTAFAFQCALILLVDLGVTNTVVPLVGDRGSDPEIIGRYIRSVRALRFRTLLIVGSASALIFPFVMRNQPWPWPAKASLWVAVLASLFFSMNDVYRAPLLIHQQLPKMYKTDIVPAIVRFTISTALHISHCLFGWIAAWFSALSFLQTALMLRRAARPYVREPEKVDPEATREIIAYLKPLWPGMLYYAFQGNIAITLIAYFGKSSNIAEFGALGRLGQLLTFLGGAISTVLLPIFARSSGRPLVKKILYSLALLIFIVSLLTLGAYVFPAPYLFLLGDTYRGLEYLIGPVVLYTCIYLIATMLNLTAAVKKWVNRSVSWLPVIVMLTVQVGYILLFGVKTTAQAVRYQTVSAVATLLLWAVIVARNLVRELKHDSGLGKPEPSESQAIEEATEAEARVVP